MLEELEQIGLDIKEARFYLAVLGLDRPTVAEAAEKAHLTRTNGYDIAQRLAARRFISYVETSSQKRGTKGRTRTVLVANDPHTLFEEWHQKKRTLDALVPQLLAIQNKVGTRPRVRYLDGDAGIRSALFETLDWPAPLHGILSMRDLIAVPGNQAMQEYIAERRARRLELKVVRSPEKDFLHGWPSSEADFRETRYAPSSRIFTMTMIIGEQSVAVISSRNENFAMMIDSKEYADTQLNLFQILWQASEPTPPDAALS